jgi:hypothetical protein
MNEKFWFDDLIFFKEKTFEEKMNLASYLVLFIFSLTTCLNYKFSIIFLVFSLLIIIIIYYNKKKQLMATNTTTENYIYEPRKVKLENGNMVSKKDRVTCNSSDKYIYGELIDSTLDNINNPEYPVDYNSPTLNQSLAGSQSLQKNRGRPVIAPRSLDMEVWRKDTSTNHSQINSESSRDLIQSGYISSYDNKNIILDSIPDAKVIENYEYKKMNKYKPQVETYNDAQGYYPENSKLNLPLNYKNNQYNLDPAVNKNMYTQTLQPGVYTRSDTIQPPISNLGISYATPNGIMEDVFQTNGELIHEIHDPALFKEFLKVPLEPSLNESTVYDPRLTGYGTSYRGYTDNLNGQPKFFYDDVNSVRMPNFIGRSNIDHIKNAEMYGQAKNLYDPALTRQMINESFTDNALQFRNEMSERLLRKRNNELWAQRKYPLSSQNQNRTGNLR